MKQTACFGLVRIGFITTVLALLPLVSSTACTISSVSSVAFGNYDVFALTATPGTGSFSVGNCSKNATTGLRSYTASLSTGSSASFASRTMKNGTNALQYNLYTTSLHATIWGDGTGSTATIANTNATLSTVTRHTIYALMPAGQDVPAGSYLDSVTITVTF